MQAVFFRSPRALSIGAVALVIAGLGAFWLTPAAAARSAMVTTQVMHFEPFLSTGAIAPGYAVTANKNGYCWTDSIASPRADAYRCFRGNEIFDPCFRNPAKTQVACALGVTPKRVLLLTLTKRLPHVSPSHGHQAWNLVMGGHVPYAGRGLHRLHTDCGFLTGATWAWHGKRANFGCTDHRTLFGHANTSTQPWTIRAGFGLHPHIRWESIRQAWF